MATEMSRPEIPTGDGHFPEDLVFEILLRLPVKSICRFRCVSPRWRAIIANPIFVSAHFDRSIARPVRLLQVFGSSPVDTDTDPAELRAFSAVEYPAATSDELTVRYFGRIPRNAHCISQSAGGLILFRTTDGLHIGNPSIGDYMALRPPRGEEYGSDSYFGISALGFDAIEKKHKVLCSMSSAKYVLTLGENEWRPIECDVGYFQEALCIDGVVHILGFGDDLKPYLILFDVRLETLRVIPFPDDYEYEGTIYIVHVGGTSGFVTVLDSELDDTEPDIEVLELEDPVNQVWVQKVFAPSDAMSCQNFMQEITRAGVVVLKPEKESYLYLFNLEDASIRKIKTCKSHPDFPRQKRGEEFNIAHHVESLQSVHCLCI